MMIFGFSTNIYPHRAEFRMVVRFGNGPMQVATIISYQLLNSGYVSLIVYDVIGNQVAELVNEVQNTGKHQVSFNASGLSSGIYIYRIIANGYNEAKKMILSK